MPIKSKAQQRLMYAAKENPEVRARTGISESVANEMIEKTPKTKFKKLKEYMSKK